MTHALDLTHLSNAVRAQDDLFRHFNGLWLETTKIDPDKTSAGAFIDLRDESEGNVRAIVESLDDAGDDAEESKIARLFHSFMAEEVIEAAGVEPLKPFLDRVEEITDVETLGRHLGWSLRHGFSSLIGFGEDADPGDPNRYTLFSGQGGLGLPDEEYYRLEEHALTLAAYREHVERMLQLAGFSDASKQADAVLRLETQIASHHWDKVRRRDLQAMFNPMSFDEMVAASPQFPWEAYIDGAELPVAKLEYVVVAQPSFLEGAAEVVTGEPIEDWQAWARWKIVHALAPYLPAAFVQGNFDFYGGTLSGTEELRPRWKRGIGFVEGAMGEAIGKLYVAKHFKSEAKTRMDELVKNLIEAYRQSINDLDWMTDETREQALDKLSKFRPKIGYPERWRDYAALEVSDNLVDNVIASDVFEFEFSLSKVLGPVDPHEWAMLPQTVNAYYHPLRNEIVFPAAILQPPFFHVDADDAVNYGAIGAVIGHEIGHGFDDKGSTTDGDGRIRDWWTEADKQAFEERTAKLVDQFEGLSPEGIEGTVNGKLTLGENIGDLGGIGIAYKAWLIAGGQPDGETIDGLTPAQRFFYSYAQIWRTKRRPELAKMLLSVDPHSPAEFRVNEIVKNVDAFHEAFSTKEGDGLWLDPEERVAIW